MILGKCKINNVERGWCADIVHLQRCACVYSSAVVAAWSKLLRCLHFELQLTALVFHVHALTLNVAGP